MYSHSTENRYNRILQLLITSTTVANPVELVGVGLLLDEQQITPKKLNQFSTVTLDLMV
ncbi:hypothetical protein [Nostoc sp.]|uniref:hypothetical protein n=1 Tax=Nostoc sp. TaxID=1180 RepID=UPI002FFC9E44